jgi:hypothetical protein
MRVPSFLFAAGGLLLSGLAWAGVPYAPNCYVPAGFTLVGQANGEPDELGAFYVIVRDADNHAVANAIVTVELADCLARGFQLCRHNPGPVCCPAPPNWPPPDESESVQRTDCDGGAVTAQACEIGQVILAIIGGAVASSAPHPEAGGACARILANGQLLATVPVAAFDLNSTGGVNAADLSVFMGDLFGAFHPRSDYNYSGTVTPADLAKLLRVMERAGSLESCSSFCP